MPHRTIETLTAWVAEFESETPRRSSAIRVIPQDGAAGADTGLVAMRLMNSPTEIYIEPPERAGEEWMITFEPRDDYVRLSSAEVQIMAAEISTLARLCAFLQRKAGESTLEGARV